METIEVIGFVDDQHRLSGEVPASVRPGAVRVHVIVEPEEETWDAAVARDWAEDWSDPREDIYTLDDGEPVDDAR